MQEKLMKWEYKTLNYDKRSFLSGKIDRVELNEKFNRLGRDGWEMVNITNSHGWGATGGVLAVFKRQL